jgi:hypothetical protein
MNATEGASNAPRRSGHPTDLGDRGEQGGEAGEAVPRAPGGGDTQDAPDTPDVPDNLDIPDTQEGADVQEGADTRDGTYARDETDAREGVTARGGVTVRESVSLSALPRPRAGGTGGVPEAAARARTQVVGAPPPGPAIPARTGVAALSLPYRLVAAVALAVAAVVACVHLGMVFLHVAPSNTVSEQHGEAIDGWVYPEFEQNWKLFAPNPLQQNIGVQVRAEIYGTNGSTRTTGWYDLSAADGQAIDGNPIPSHTQQNELRRAWDFFVSSHDNDDRPSGLRGQLSEAYLRRIVAMRLERGGLPGPDATLARVQIRSRTVNVRPPDWSHEKVPTQPVYRTLPWWSVSSGGGDAR